MKVPVPQYYYALLNVLLRLKDYGYSGNVIFQRGKIKNPPQDLIDFSKKFTDLFGDVSVDDDEIIHTKQEQKHKWELTNNLISGSAKALFNTEGIKVNHAIILESGSGGTKCAVCFRDSANLIWQCVHKEKIAIASENTGELQEFVSNVRKESRDAPLAIVFSGGFVSTYQNNDGLLNTWMTANRGLDPNLQIPTVPEISRATHRLKETCQQREAEHEYKGFLAVFPEYEKATQDNIVFVGMGGGTVQCCVNGDYQPEVTEGIEGFNLKKGEQGNFVETPIFEPGKNNNICILSSTCFHIVDKQVDEPTLQLGLKKDQQYDIDRVVNTIKEKLRACFGLQ